MEVHVKAIPVAAAIAAFTVFTAMPARAQQATCHPISPTDRVVVTTSDNSKVRGTVVCLTDRSLMLFRDGATTETPLAEIQRIETRSDPFWDGAAKGAAIPIVLWAVFCRSCDAEYMFQSIAAYSMIGATWDALQRNTRTIYTGRPSPSIGFRVRF
jgi:hypothetical protein